MKKIKNYLLIDGEYYEKHIKPKYDNLYDIVLKYFGYFAYPDEIIYYGAKICENKKEELSKVKNIVFNEKGYIINKSDCSRQQKGVDGYIVSDLTDLSHQEVGIVALISGDGDMKAGVEKLFLRKNKKVQLIGVEDSISKELLKFCDIHYIDKDFEDIFNERKDEKEENLELEKESLNENSNFDDTSFEKFKELYLYLKEKENKVTMTLIGQNAKKKGFKYQKGKLRSILEKFQTQGKLALTRQKGTPDYFVELCE